MFFFNKDEHKVERTQNNTGIYMRLQN